MSTLLPPVRGRPGLALLLAGTLALLGSRATAGELEIESIQLAASLLGRPRAAFLPGEVVVVRFDLAGARLAADGELALETGIRVRDAEGKVLADEPVAAGIRTPNLFRADRIPCFFSIPPQVLGEPGSYTLTLRAVDRAGAPPREARAEVSVTLRERSFALGNQRVALDPQGSFESTGPFRVGQTLFFCQHVVGFGIGGGKVHLQLDVEVRDRGGALLGRKENQHTLEHELQERPPHLLMSTFLNLTRAGEFEVRVAVVDHNLKKRSQAVYRIRVLERPED